ncbi:MAG: DUF3293 domain-containing protein [Akkermansiaceae bacterium]
MKEDYHQTQFFTQLERVSSPDHFYIITAHNPSGEVTPDETNDENNTLFLEALQASKWSYSPVTGKCEDHAEAGFGVRCSGVRCSGVRCSGVEAITLGKQSRQDALYEICDDQVVLVDCKEIEADEMVGKWSELQAPTS